MAKHIKKVNGKFVDVNNGNTVFHGHCTKDLDIGDMYDDDESGKTMQIKEIIPIGTSGKLVRSVSV